MSTGWIVRSCVAWLHRGTYLLTDELRRRRIEVEDGGSMEGLESGGGGKGGDLDRGPTGPEV